MISATSVCLGIAQKYFTILRYIPSHLNVVQVLNIIMTEAYKLKQLSMTTETVTKVVEMIKEGTKTPDPSALLVDLSKTVSADIGRLVCSAVRKMNPKTFYMPVLYPKRSKKKSLTFD